MRPRRPMRLLGLLWAAASLTAVSALAEPLVFHAVGPGRQALDAGDDGGNPFASALIEVLRRPRADLDTMATEIARLTSLRSGQRMAADVPPLGARGTWLLAPPAVGERRVALVLVVADYTRAGAQSLPGARRDAERIASALATAGFETETALDLGRSAILHRLAEFARRSADADAAVIYSTGHGVEVEGSIYLLPADFPVEQGRAALRSRAVVLADVVRALKAGKVNLVFYGGCRDDPFGN